MKSFPFPPLNPFVHSLWSRGKSRRKPTSTQFHRVTLPEGLEDRTLMAGDFAGTVFNDLNANGVKDTTDNGLAGWTVFADTNNDGQYTPGEPAAVSDVKGKFTLLGLPAGDVTIYEIVQPEFKPTPGFTDHQMVSIRDGRTTKSDFPNVTDPVVTGRVVGTVFEDTNENGTKDPGEHGLTGWSVFVDTNGDGNLTPGEASAITNTDGDYVIADVMAGSATVYETPQGGFAPIQGGLFPLSGATTHHQVTVVAGGSVRTDFANLIPPVGTIQGTVWNDANGDGLRGTGEAPLSGQTVYIDLDNNGQQDPTDPARITDASGTYSFTDIHTGTYRVVEVIPEGFISADNRSTVVTANVFRGSVQSVDFYNLTPASGSISGVLFNDLDGNGLRSAAESGLAGWQVYADLNSNSLFDVGEPIATTAADGSYGISGLAYGNVTLRDIVPDTWIATSPVAGATMIHLLNGEARTGIDLGNRERIGTIQGTVWNDANGDRLRGTDEFGMPDSVVFLDLNHDGIQDVTEPATLTDATGKYSFSRVPTGTYTVVEVVPTGWITSIGKPSTLTTTLGIGGVNVADFYNLLPVPGSISGTIWSDVNSNGVLDAGEPGLEGWQVYVDANQNGVFDAGELQATTSATGTYTLSGVAYGTTSIREVSQSGLTSTTPAVINTLLLNGEVRQGINFGNHEPTDYVISGMAFNDVNQDGLRELGESGVSGVTVFIDANNNGLQDPGEPSTISSVDLFYTPAVNEIGTYSFTHLARGTYHVMEIVPAILEGTPATVRETYVSVGPTSRLDVDFADQYRANEIHGVIFDDTNANHVHDAQEHVRSGVSVYIDVNRDNLYEADEPRTVTGADGSYAFLGLTPGAYIVREDQGTAAGPYTYPQTGGGILWPEGVSHPSVGNVTPASITASLAEGESYTQTVTLTLPGTGTLTNLVDVFLLFDDTGSFTSNSPIVRAAFPTIIDTLQTALPGIDLGFGVGRFEEYGNFASEFSTGRPFILNQPIVANSTPGSAAAIQAALDRVAPGYGGDGPETDIEALYQLVTGAGFDGNGNGSVLDSGAAGLYSTQVTPGASGDVPSFASFTADTANGVLAAAGNVGGGGFRTGALPIVLLATDTGFAYQPQGETTITGTGGVTLPLSALTQMSRPSTPFGAGAGIQQTVTGLNALGALVIGLGTNPDAAAAPRSSLEALSQLTGAVNRSTSTIANGTIDAIAPGDPLYFQIGAGFGSTVADGVINAIQNAVTNVAMDITVRASDPRVRIINHTGTLTGIGAGQTAAFDFEFIGDGRPHRFDLEFVRAGTNVVLGSIPVVLGTPVAGEGYSYEELADGEIHQSSHFGNYVANEAPSFTGGTDVIVSEDAGAQTVTTWATGVSAGPATEAGQTVDFVVSNDNPALFSSQPKIAADGTLTFTPAANASGIALVTVRLHDNGGIGLSGTDISAPQTFWISVTAVNDPPSATDDVYSTTEGTDLVVAGSGLLSNDSDVEGAALIANVVTNPTHGSLTLNGDGTFRYTPDAGYFGTDQFSYVANDSSLDSNVATVTITVTHTNQVPVAHSDSYSVAEDTVLSSMFPGVFANDTDLDGDPLTAALVSGPAHGTVVFNSDGSFVYTPVLNFNGLDSFTYRANDGTVDSNIADVTILVTAVNDAPVAANDSFSVAEDNPLAVNLRGVLINDRDDDSDAIEAILVTGTAHGNLVLNADGSFLYTPAPNFNGTDSFVYKANDGIADSNLATVTIVVTAVNDAPVAADNAYAATEDNTLSVALPGLLANDVDVDGNVLSAIRLSGPTHGSLTLNPNGSFIYTPSLNFNGTDSFTYQASDGVTVSNVATVTITVAAVNDVPVAGNDSYVTNQNVALIVPARGVLLNDSDADGDALNASVVTGPAHGALTLNADGSFSYTPAVNYSGGDSFTYRAADAVSQSGLATVSLTVVPVAPITKFFVADVDRAATFQYAGDGAAITNGALNKSDSKPRGIASNSSGTIQWVIDSSGTVFVYDNAANLLGQWTPQNVGKPEGITLWGNDLWLVDPNQDKVFKFTGGANLRSGRVNATSSFALNSANLNATDLVTDGSHLWVVNDTTTTDKVFRYSTSGTLEGSWTISSSNPSPTGITLDPSNVNHLWIVDSATDRVYQYDGATARLAGSQEPSLSFALAATNTNPQGIADPQPAVIANVGTRSLDGVMEQIGRQPLVSDGGQLEGEHRGRQHQGHVAGHRRATADDHRQPATGRRRVDDIIPETPEAEAHSADLDAVFAGLFDDQQLPSQRRGPHQRHRRHA